MCAACRRRAADDRPVTVQPTTWTHDAALRTTLDKLASKES